LGFLLLNKRMNLPAGVRCTFRAVYLARHSELMGDLVYVLLSNRVKLPFWNSEEQPTVQRINVWKMESGSLTDAPGSYYSLILTQG